MTLTPGSRLGPYEIVALLGKGGMGEVYRARDPRLRRDVAIKVMATSADPDRLRRFEQEARAAAALNHPNILVIYDFGVHNDQPFVVTELLEGQTLRERLLPNTALPLKKVIEYAIQITSGLAAAHAKGIVHRDLKPANLFVTTDGRVKILDFGLAKLTERAAIDPSSDISTSELASLAGTIVGTVNYMSPEQVRGRAVDHRSDIFSFGLVLYETLTGRRAFDRPSPVETMSAAANEEPPGMADLLLTLPVEMQLVLQHCLEKSPEDRFQSARDLCFQLTTLAHAMRPVRPLPADTPRRAPSWRAMVVLAAAIVVALAGSFVGGMWTTRVPLPAYQQLTFRRGSVLSARFAVDGHTIVYGAAWDGRPTELWSTRPESPESRQLGIADADILAVSATGEMAVLLGRRNSGGVGSGGTLGRLPLDASAAREVLTGVDDADWSPDGQSLAVAHVVQGKYRLEFPIGTLRYETEGWINRVRVSPDGSYVAFVDHPLYNDDRGAVCVIPRTGGNKQVLSEGWSSVTGLVWSASGNELWFTAAELGATASLYAVNLSGRVRPVMRSPNRLSVQDIDREGRVLLTESKFRMRIGARDLRSSGDKEADLSWLDGSFAADLSADGTTLLINEQAAGAGTPLYAVYVRKTDGSPAVRIGEGSSPALSPDGTWAAALALRAPPSVTLLPTRAGQSRTLARGTLNDYQAVTWFPDGRRLLLAGSERGRGVRLWTQEISDGGPRAVSTEGLRIASFGRPIAPDGSRVAAIDSSGRIWVHPLNGVDAPGLIEGLEAANLPIRWDADGQSLYVFRNAQVPATVYRYHLADRRMERVAVLTPSDAAGVGMFESVQTTPDGSLFVYTYVQTLSDLFLVGNLR